VSLKLALYVIAFVVAAVAVRRFRRNHGGTLTAVVRIGLALFALMWMVHYTGLDTETFAPIVRPVTRYFGLDHLEYSNSNEGR
jgi:hypothetical protein